MDENIRVCVIMLFCGLQLNFLNVFLYFRDNNIKKCDLTLSWVRGSDLTTSRKWSNLVLGPGKWPDNLQEMTWKPRCLKVFKEWIGGICLPIYLRAEVAGTFYLSNSQQYPSNFNLINIVKDNVVEDMILDINTY